MTSVRHIAGGVLATVLAASWGATTQADGGRVCVSERAGPWQIAVFTSPTPPSLGVVDVSVLVQDEATHQVARDVAVTVEAQHVATGTLVRNQATAANATNKLLQSATCRWDAAGRWHVIVCISNQLAESQRVAFDVTVISGANPPLELAYWIGWPIVPIALFIAHQCLVRRKETVLAR